MFIFNCCKGCKGQQQFLDGTSISVDNLTVARPASLR